MDKEAGVETPLAEEPEEGPGTEDQEDVDQVINKLQEELKVEDIKREKAERKQYKYKEVFGKTFYTDIPQKKIL